MRLPVLLAIALFVAGAMSTSAFAQDEKLISDPDVVIEVGGLTCELCAYRIEKRLRKIEEIEELSVYLEEGRVEVSLVDGATVSRERVEEAVSDAGFEMKSIVFAREEAEEEQSDSGT